MIENAQWALQIESAFLAGVEANLERTRGKQSWGSSRQVSRQAEKGNQGTPPTTQRCNGQTALDRLPGHRRIVVRRFERRWWLGKRCTAVTIASVLMPQEHLVTEAGGPPPVELGELVDHVRALVGKPDVPHVVGVCCPSGFAPDVRNSQLELLNVTLVLVEPQEDGGWLVGSTSADVPEHVLALFDPTATSRKLDAVRAEIERRRADLLVSGLNAATLAARLDLPPAAVEEVFEQAALGDPELRLTRQAGEVVLSRGTIPVSQTRVGPGVIDRIRALFDRDGQEAEKVHLLAEQRAGLNQRRDRVYEDTARLEQQEAELLAQGRRTSSASARRRLAGRLAGLRRDIRRQHALADLINSQIEVVSTHIHHLTLIQQGQMAELPGTEELTQHAVEAEELLANLRSEADLAAHLEAGINALTTSDEESAILREFDATARSEQAGAAGATDAAPASEQELSPPEPDNNRRPAAAEDA